MRSRMCKVLHPAAGRPLLSHVLSAVEAAGAVPTVVLSQESEPARAILPPGTVVARQDPPKGTGDAVRVALEAIPDLGGPAFIVYGDAPLLRPETLARMAKLLEERGAVLTLLTADLGTENDYGRVIRGPSGDVERVVELKLA